MERLTHYQNLVKAFMSEFAKLANNPPMPDAEIMPVFDDEHNQYVLFKIGWTKNGRLHHITKHVRLRDGKFWIEEDWTENGIATYLVSKGVPREEIVLAFHPPEVRPLTDYAVA
jgi:hypothetical protein